MDEKAIIIICITALVCVSITCGAILITSNHNTTVENNSTEINSTTNNTINDTTINATNNVSSDNTPDSGDGTSTNNEIEKSSNNGQEITGIITNGKGEVDAYRTGHEPIKEKKSSSKKNKKAAQKGAYNPKDLSSNYELRLTEDKIHAHYVEV